MNERNEKQFITGEWVKERIAVVRRNLTSKIEDAGNPCRRRILPWTSGARIARLLSLLEKTRASRAATWRRNWSQMAVWEPMNEQNSSSRRWSRLSSVQCSVVRCQSSYVNPISLAINHKF